MKQPGKAVRAGKVARRLFDKDILKVGQWRVGDGIGRSIFGRFADW